MEKEKPDIVNTEEITMQELAQEYMDTLPDPDKLYTNNGVFNGLLRYIYNNYVKNILNNTHKNGNRYNIKQLDRLFDLYTYLVYMYKSNSKPNMIEFTLFCNISHETLCRYNRDSEVEKLTNEEYEIIQKWRKTCENALVNGGSVFDIFLLKSKYGYVEESAKQPIINAQNVIQVASLPDMDSLMLTTKSKDVT